MQREIFTLTTILLAAIAMSAAPISRQQALNRAQASLAKQGININVADMQEAMPLKAQSTHAAATQAYYVFNSSSSFVIAAGDDRMPEVLGYSDSGTIDLGDMPYGLKELLDMYARAAAVSNDCAPAATPATSTPRAPIAPLLKSKWDQASPFNLKAPMIGQERCAAGCVAVAMAQVMNYWKWPESIDKPIDAYTSTKDELSVYMPQLSAEGFPGWANIKDYYQNEPETTPAAIDVATLLLYCGQSIWTNYGVASSSTTSRIPTMLTKYFQYAPTGRYRVRGNYTTQQWEDILYNELANMRPVVYNGSSYNTRIGHAFVCDGIDANGLYHINWGWGGKSDGYFKLTNLTPQDQGIGSSISNDGYIYGNMGMVTGMAPMGQIEVNPTPVLLCASNVIPATTLATRSNDSESFTAVKLHGKFTNAMVGKTIKTKCALALYDTSGNFISTLASNDTQQLGAGMYIEQDWECTVSEHIAAGNYLIYPVYAYPQDQEWSLCEGAQVNCIKATVTNNTLSLEPVGNNAKPRYQVTNVEFIGPNQANRTIETVVDISNAGDTHFHYIYLFLDGSCMTVAQCGLAPGQSGQATMHFIAPAEGNHTIKIALDEKGQEGVLWTGTYTVAPPSHTFVTINNIVVHNATDGDTLMGNHLDFSFRASCTDADYNDFLLARIYKRTGEYSFKLIRTLSFPVNLKQGCDTTITGSFDNLEPGESYQAYFGQYYNGKVYIPKSTPWYTCVDGPQAPYDINNDGVVDIVDINTIIHILLFEDYASPFFKRADINGDGIVDIVDVNTLVMHALTQE